MGTSAGRGARSVGREIKGNIKDQGSIGKMLIFVQIKKKKSYEKKRKPVFFYARMTNLMLQKLFDPKKKVKNLMPEKTNLMLKRQI